MILRKHRLKLQDKKAMIFATYSRIVQKKPTVCVRLCASVCTERKMIKEIR